MPLMPLAGCCRRMISAQDPRKDHGLHANSEGAWWQITSWESSADRDSAYLAAKLGQYGPEAGSMNIDWYVQPPWRHTFNLRGWAQEVREGRGAGVGFSKSATYSVCFMQLSVLTAMWSKGRNGLMGGAHARWLQPVVAAVQPVTASMCRFSTAIKTSQIPELRGS